MVIKRYIEEDKNKFFVLLFIDLSIYIPKMLFIPSSIPSAEGIKIHKCGVSVH